MSAPPAYAAAGFGASAAAAGWRSAVRRRRGRRRAFDAGRQREDETAFRHLVADLHLQVRHRTRGRRRHIHRGLVRFERNERILGLQRVTRLDEHLDDRDVLEVADVGHADLDRLVDTRRTVVGRRCARRRGMAALLDFLWRRDTGRRSVGVDGDDQRAFGYLVADLDLEFLDDTIDGRRYVHRRLVRLERNRADPRLSPCRRP